jgi:uncharacterized membrane protein YgdD (TMEM256/DUF423 family)
MGWILVVGGFVAMAAALFMPAGMNDIANLDMLNMRSSMAVIGGAVFISGWLALILERMPKSETKNGSDFGEGQY